MTGMPEPARRSAASLKAWAARLQQRRAQLAAEARARGLRQLPTPYSRVWVDSGHDRGSLPERFFVERYLGDDEPRLAEYHVTFPIENLDQLVQALRAVDALYFAAEDTVSYARYGVEGLLDFLEQLREPGLSPEPRAQSQ